MITKKQIFELLDKWPVEHAYPDDIKPEYRAPTCFCCTKFIRKAWHIHYEMKDQHRELHLCAKCGRKYGL
jgi:hypothetical protein